MWCYSFDVSFKPATDDNASFASFASAPVGNLINCPRRLAISIATSLMHLPAELLDIDRESPIKRCMAPEAKNRRHKRTCNRGGRGQFLRVGRDRSGRRPMRYRIVSGRKRYLSNISSSSRSSSGFDLSRKTRGRRSWRFWIIRRTANLLWAAIFVSSTTLSTLQSLLEKLPFCTQPEYE